MQGYVNGFILFSSHSGRLPVHARVHERLHRAQLGGSARAAGRERGQRDRAAAWRECRLEVGIIRVDREAVPLVKSDAPRGQLRLRQLRLQAGGLS